MLNNSEKKEPDVFEQEMEYRIGNLTEAIRSNAGHGSYTKGERSGFTYALEIYREYRKDGTL